MDEPLPYEQFAGVIDDINSNLNNVIQSDYEPLKTIAEFHNDDSFFRGIRGPIGSGKTAGCVAEIWFSGPRL